MTNDKWQESHFTFDGSRDQRDLLFETAIEAARLLGKAKDRYRDDPAFRAAQLPHRSDEELARLEGCIGWTTWADLMDTVLDNSADFPVEHKSLLRELVEYLKERKLLHKGG